MGAGLNPLRSNKNKQGTHETKENGQIQRIRTTEEACTQKPITSKDGGSTLTK